MYPNIEWSHIPHRPKMIAVKSRTKIPLGKIISSKLVINGITLDPMHDLVKWGVFSTRSHNSSFDDHINTGIACNM